MSCTYDHVMSPRAKKAPPRPSTLSVVATTRRSRGTSQEEEPVEPSRASSGRTHLTTVGLSPGLFEFLEQRGAKSDRGKGPLNRSGMLRRKIDLLSALFERSNPLETRDFPPAYVDLLAEVLPEPWSLSSDEILLLEHVVARRPSLAKSAKARRVNVDDLVSRLAALDFAERLALVDLLEQHVARAGSSPTK